MWEAIKSSPFILITLSCLFCCFLLVSLYVAQRVIKNGGSFKITRDGLEVSNSKGRGLHSNKTVFQACADISSRVAKLVEEEVDKIHGIKERCYQQSIEYAESTVNALAYKVIETYKKKYIQTYSGTNPDLDGCPTKTQIENLSSNSKENKKESFPCEKICKKGCNSGVYYFECRFIKDIRIISDRLKAVITENHLINRTDREYEEEVNSLAESCVYEVFSRVVSYTVPVDNRLAVETLEEYRHDFLSQIADSLRRSRTLSQKKRDDISSIQSKSDKGIQEAIKSVLTLISTNVEVKVNRNIPQDED